MTQDIVVPGVRLCEADERHVAGPGTYAQHGYIYSSLLGQLRLVNTPNKAVSVEVIVAFLHLKSSVVDRHGVEGTFT
jgi:exosome complex RNA-binding protein Rrp4